jgi:metal-responsive CopG/Arc/MetJ family transcriptional regulator
MTVRDLNKKITKQIHIWISPNLIKKLDQLLYVEGYGASRSKYIRDLITKSYDEEFDVEAEE